MKFNNLKNVNGQSLSDAFKKLEAVIELQEDKNELASMGLTQEEIDGYEEFFLDNYFVKPLSTVIE